MNIERERSAEPPIIQYWHSEEVPDYIAGLLETVEEHNRERPHLVFNRPSAAAFVESHLGTRWLRAFMACAVPAMQADYFRYCAALVLGGAFCDADARCVAGMRSLLPPPGRGRLFLRADGLAIVNGLFAFGSPGHAFLELALEVATANIERRSSDSVYATTGPLIFTNLYWLRRLGSFDTLIARAAAGPYEEDTRAFCAVVDDCARVDRAFEGVRISPVSENAWLRPPGSPLPYKKTAAHWYNAKGGIFNADPDRGG